jgi:dipeptidyl aminopeptidase/acylaminoacyl peptidase
LPENLWKPPGRVAPIRALHGADDRVVALADAEATVRALQSGGSDVKIEVFPGVGHTLSRDIRERAALYTTEWSGRTTGLPVRLPEAR